MFDFRGGLPFLVGHALLEPDGIASRYDMESPSRGSNFKTSCSLLYPIFISPKMGWSMGTLGNQIRQPQVGHLTPSTVFPGPGKPNGSKQSWRRCTRCPLAAPWNPVHCANIFGCTRLCCMLLQVLQDNVLPPMCHMFHPSGEGLVFRYF